MIKFGFSTLSNRESFLLSREETLNITEINIKKLNITILWLMINSKIKIKRNRITAFFYYKKHNKKVFKILNFTLLLN